MRAGQFGQAASVLLRAGTAPHLPERDLRRLDSQIEGCLDPRIGEVVARLRAGEVAVRYATLDQMGRQRFFRHLADRYGIDVGAATQAAAAFQIASQQFTTEDPPRAVGSAGLPLETTRGKLRDTLQARWDRLFQLFCSLDGGVKLAVDLRADLLEELSSSPELAPLEADLHRTLASLFNIGLLNLRTVTWDTPASFLEKLIRYEAVHEITSWADLQNRLQPDRRCYAFVHPGMPDEPLIFVEVALVIGLASEIPPLLDQTAPVGDPTIADTAIFYSISACQPGLAGVNLGDFLIKRVVADLSKDLPNLRHFATLSPIPGLRRWIDRLENGPLDALLTSEQRSALATLDPAADTAQVMKGVLARTDWPGDAAANLALRAPLLRLAAHYLTREPRHGRAEDRVANFHLTNGAQVERLNWLANPAPAGLRESAGIMVNYRYDLDRIESNHIGYVQNGRIRASSSITKLLS